MLTVPSPTLRYDPVAPGLATLEKPVTVLVGPVIDDGRPLGPADLSVFGLLSFRRLAPGSSPEVWDGKAKRWLPDPEQGRTGIAPAALAFVAGDPAPWQGIVVAAAGNDALGAPQFGRATAGYPAYTFRAVFGTKSGGIGIGAPSGAVGFVGVADRNLMVMGPADGEKPDNATEARVLLRNPALQTIGGLVVRRDSPGAEVTLSNSAGASLVLRLDGSIELRPAPGAGLLVAADIETERIRYRPADGGAKKTLF